MYKSATNTEIAFASENSRIFADNWASLPKVDLIPMRSAFDPADLPKILPNFEIHEIVGPELIRIRLSGTTVVERYSAEVTGKNYLDIVHPSRREKVSRALLNIVRHPCGMVVLIRSVRESGMVLVDESVGFPFRNEKGQPNQIIYQTNVLGQPKEFWDYWADARIASNALRRRYLDIGAGVPDWDHAEDEI